MTQNVKVVVVVVVVVVILLPTQGGRHQQLFLLGNDKKCATDTKCNNSIISSTHSTSTVSAYSDIKCMNSTDSGSIIAPY